MDLYFLGTGAGLPSRDRNVTSIALRLHDESRGIWLFDCGEGTQHQVLTSPLKLSRLERVFVTHLHGDHIYGLPGLLSSRSFQTDSPLVLYGPKGIERFVWQTLDSSYCHLGFELEVIEIEDRMEWQDGEFHIQTRLLNHAVPSYGYRIEESDRPGRLRADALAAQGVPPSPLYGVLKAGHDVELPDGRLIRAADYVEPPLPGRVVVILGDTRPSKGAQVLATGCDVLVHEATFASQEDHLAWDYGHSTATQAAQIALEAGAKSLILTHISARYTPESSASLLNEARMVFPNAHIAFDHALFRIPHRPDVVSR